MQRWVSDLFEDWLGGRLVLPMRVMPDGSQHVHPAGSDFGGTRRLCKRLPSVMNYVSGCNCKLTPQCTSRTEHKYTYFFGSSGIIAEENIPSPVPTSCSYFRQLEQFKDEGLRGYNPRIDMLNSTLGSGARRAGVTLSYMLNLTEILDEKPYDLRTRMHAGMVARWDPALDYMDAGTGMTKVWSDYYDECRPRRCYYEKVTEASLVSYLVVLLSLVGGLVPLLKSASRGAAIVLFKVCGDADKTAKDDAKEKRPLSLVKGRSPFSFRVAQMTDSVIEQLDSLQKERTTGASTSLGSFKKQRDGVGRMFSKMRASKVAPTAEV
eukprot:g596.t1